MELREIKLAASDSNWRLFLVRKADPAFLKFQEKIFIRDDYHCQFCGFCSRHYQEVINIDGNYLNNKVSNLATACSFCAQCFFLEAIGKSDFGGGSLIFLPEMTQTELNALCHVLFANQATAGPHASQAKNIYRSLKLRTQPIEQQLGEGFSNPAIFGQVLVDTKVENAEQLHEKLAPAIRVLPSMSRYAQQIATWVREGVKECASL